MTDTQLYLAIGIPSLLFALNFLAILWQSRGVEKRIDQRFDSLEKVLDARFAAVDARFETAYQQLLRVEGVLDARLKHLEER